MTHPIRAQLAEALEAGLPDRKYHVVPSVETVKKIAKNTIQLELSSFAPSPNARGQRVVEVTVHVITRMENVTAAAEDAVDALAFEVFEALEAIPWTNPTRADKAVYNDTNLSYKITTEILTKRSTS